MKRGISIRDDVDKAFVDRFRSGEEGFSGAIEYAMLAVLAVEKPEAFSELKKKTKGLKDLLLVEEVERKYLKK